MPSSRFPVDPRAAAYYDRLSTERALAYARERIEEWDYETDPHGYCHERPMLVALVEEIERPFVLPDMRARVLPSSSVVPLSVELGDSAGGGHSWASIKLGDATLFEAMVPDPADHNIIGEFASRLRRLLADS